MLSVVEMFVDELVEDGAVEEARVVGTVAKTDAVDEDAAEHAVVASPTPAALRESTSARRSEVTRATCQAALTKMSETSAVTKGRAAGLAADAAELVAYEKKLGRVKAAVLRHSGVEPISSSPIRKKIPARDRDLFDEAVLELAQEGLIEVFEVGDGTKIRLAQKPVGKPSDPFA